MSEAFCPWGMAQYYKFPGFLMPLLPFGYLSQAPGAKLLAAVRAPPRLSSRQSKGTLTLRSQKGVLLGPTTPLTILKVVIVLVK